MSKKNYMFIYDSMLLEYINKRKVLTALYKSCSDSIQSRKYYSRCLNDTRKKIKAIKNAIYNQKIIDNLTNIL